MKNGCVIAPAVVFELQQRSVDLVDDRFLFREVSDLLEVLLEEFTVEEYVFTVVTVFEVRISDEVTDSTLLAVTLEFLDVAAAS